MCQGAMCSGSRKNDSEAVRSQTLPSLNSVDCTSKVLNLVNHGNSQRETQKSETWVIGVFAWGQHLKWKEILKAATNTPSPKWILLLLNLEKKFSRHKENPVFHLTRVLSWLLAKRSNAGFLKHDVGQLFTHSNGVQLNSYLIPSTKMNFKWWNL